MTVYVANGGRDKQEDAPVFFGRRIILRGCIFLGSLQVLILKMCGWDYVKAFRVEGSKDSETVLTDS